MASEDCYCVECLTNIGPKTEEHDGMCDRCREHIENGGEPVQLSIVNMFGVEPMTASKNRKRG